MGKRRNADQTTEVTPKLTAAMKSRIQISEQLNVPLGAVKQFLIETTSWLHGVER